MKGSHSITVRIYELIGDANNNYIRYVLSWKTNQVNVSFNRPIVNMGE